AALRAARRLRTRGVGRRLPHNGSQHLSAGQATGSTEPVTPAAIRRNRALLRERVWLSIGANGERDALGERRRKDALLAGQPYATSHISCPSSRLNSAPIPCGTVGRCLLQPRRAGAWGDT